jgi:hypothetical protein
MLLDQRADCSRAVAAHATLFCNSDAMRSSALGLDKGTAIDAAASTVVAMTAATCPYPGITVDARGFAHR